MEITNVQLDAALAECITSGALLDGFASLALDVARIMYNSPKYNHIHQQIKEEWISAYSLTLVRHWDRIKPGRNTKSYLYTMAGWASAECRRSYAKRAGREKKIKEFAELWEPATVIVL